MVVNDEYNGHCNLISARRSEQDRKRVGEVIVRTEFKNEFENFQLASPR